MTGSLTNSNAKPLHPLHCLFSWNRSILRRQWEKYICQILTQQYSTKPGNRVEKLKIGILYLGAWSSCVGWIFKINFYRSDGLGIFY